MRWSECESSIRLKVHAGAGNHRTGHSYARFSRNGCHLALRRPAKQPMASVEGKTRPLAANFSAPISYYQPPGNLLLTVGLMAGLRSQSLYGQDWLVFPAALRSRPNSPCSRARPFSTPFDWAQTINGLKPTRKSANIINSGSLAIRPATPSSILHCDCAKSWPRSTNFIRTIARTLL